VKPSYLYLGQAPFSLVTYNRVIVVFWLLPGLIWVELLYAQRLRSLSAGARRAVAPLFFGAMIPAGVWAYVGFAPLLWGPPFALEQAWLFIAFTFVFSALAISGLFFTWRARGVVGDLVLDLGRLGPAGVREALARALGDPTVRLGYWLPDRQLWADENGAE